MLLAPLVWILALAVAAFFALKWWWFPGPISDHARQFDRFFDITLWITGAIFLAAQLVLGYVIVRFRRRDGAPSIPPPNERLEFLWTSAAAILFVGLGLSTIQVWTGLHLGAAPPGALVVEALGKQFAWSFRYAGADSKFGRTSIKLINDASSNPFGLDDADPAAKDDLVSSALRVPAGVPVELRLKSRDVLHNFFVRELRIKQDLVPGMEIPLRFTADTPGTYEVACSELCGLGHHQMRTTLIVLPPEEFEAWKRQMADQLKGQGQ